MQPLPWGLGAKCADIKIAAEFCKAVIYYRETCSDRRTNEIWYKFGSRTYHDVSSWMHQLSWKFPAIVINLARRTDRY